jgi:tape measure domain-containing protein
MADVNIIIDVASKGAVKELNKLEKEFKDLGVQAEKSGDKSSKGFSVMSKAAAGSAVAVAAIGAAAVSALNQASKFQDLETQFIAFTGSAEAAAEQVERIAEFSGQTPFQVDELAKANKTLLAFGSSTEESFVQLKQLGEVAAATGQNIGELSQIFGQIQVAGKLTGERFNQLAERSVNLGPVLAKSLGVAETEIRGLISAGKISSEEVAKAFATMTTGAGQFAGGMERLSKTFSGAKSTLSDNIDLLAADLGKKLLPAATDVTIALTRGIQAIRAWFNESKPEKLRKLNNELKDTEEELAGLSGGFSNSVKNALGFGDTSEEIAKKSEDLKKKIADLKNEIVDVSTAKPAEKAKEAREEKTEDSGTQSQEQITSAEKLNAELAQLNQQKIANKSATAASENAIVLEQLDAERQIILQKEEEKNIALLESQGLFEEAQLLKAEAQAERLNEVKQREEEERLAIIKKARADEFNFNKINSKAEIKFAQQTWIERAKTAQVGLSAIASLQSTGSKQLFEIGKAAAIAQTLIAIPEAAQKAYTSLAAFPPLAAAAAAAAVVSGVARVNQIKSTKFTAFAEGGEVTGGIPGLDSVPALLTPGEVVAPKKNFKDLEMGNDETVSILNSINDSIETLISLQTQISETGADEAEQAPIMVELTLDGEVLASRILELNQDNARIA